MTFYKIVTHDFRPPLQGGAPIWDGVTLPFQLPAVRVDMGSAECSYGWNVVDDLAEGFKIAGFWPSGRPAVALVVTPAADVIQRGKKWRASTVAIERLATESEVAQAIGAFSTCFGAHAERMAEEQLAWRAALARPKLDPVAVKVHLAEALEARGLGDWTTQSYESPWAAWDARAAWAAWAALTVCYAALQGWTKDDPLLLTTGIREAYAAGLELAIPTGPKTLGYALAEQKAG